MDTTSLQRLKSIHAKFTPCQNLSLRNFVFVSTYLKNFCYGFHFCCFIGVYFVLVFCCFTLNKCIFYWFEQVKKLNSKMTARKKDDQKQPLRVLPGKRCFEKSAISFKTSERVPIPSRVPILLLKRKVL